MGTFSRPGQARPWNGTTRAGTGRQTSTRPTTARPATQAGRPTTAASTTNLRNDGTWVIAVLEARGVGREVGLAALERDTGRVMLVQVG
jgi:DNA mismatch repair protein MSH4